MSKPKPHFYRFPTAGLFADYRTLPPTELNVFRAARAFLAFADMDAVRMAGLLGAGPALAGPATGHLAATCSAPQAAHLI